MKIKRVLVTGGAGFIGSHLVRALVALGVEVGVIEKEGSDFWRIKDLVERLRIYSIDLRDTSAVSVAVSDFKPEAVFHLATYYAVDHKPEEVALITDTNVLGAVNLLDAAREFGVKLFVNTSSCFVYKQGSGKLTEESPQSPLNLYALSKLQAEQACSFYAEKYGMQSVTFRLFPPYGPGDNERRLIPYAIKTMLSGESMKLTTGKQKWDFVYVGDIVEAYLKLLSKNVFPQKHEVFNIGSGNVVSVRDVVTRIKEITESKSKLEWGAVPHRKSEVWHTCADVRKAGKLLDWKPKMRILDGGLKKTVAGHKGR